MAASITIDRTTTQTELGGLYLDWCGYNTAVGAENFMVICRAMLRRGLTSYESPGGVKFNLAPSVLERLIAEARTFARKNDPARAAGQAIHLRFAENFRE